MASTEQPGEVPGVNVSGPGIQVGTGNVQNNTWTHKPPLDPAALGALNPHVAVVRLQELGHRELVDFFARAKPEDVSEIVTAFLEVDLTKIVAALGDINRRKAAELIGAAIDREDSIDDLPEGAEAIAREAARAGWADPEPLAVFSEGYIRKYKNGRVFWAPYFKVVRKPPVVRTTGAIDDYWTEKGTDRGFPVDDQKTAPTSPYGTTGVQQRFKPSTVYSSKHGVFLITDAVCYDDDGGSGGWLGFPVSGRERNGQFGDRQMFEGGTVYSYVVEGPEGLRSFAARRELVDALPDDRRWRPVSKVTHTVSSSGTPSALQHFEVGLESGTCATAVYSSKHHGPVMVAPEVWDYYSKLGAEKSRLGFPTRRSMASRGNGIQQFEGGRINAVKLSRCRVAVHISTGGFFNLCGFPVRGS